MRRTKLVSFALAALVLTAGAACAKDETTTTGASGGVVAESKSGDGSTTTKADKSTTTKDDSGDDSGDETTTTKKKKTTTTEGDSTDTTEGDSTDTTLSGMPADLDACLEASKVWTAIAGSVSTLMTPGASQSDIDKIQDQIDEVRAGIPDELKSDFDTWSDGFTQYAKVAKEINGDYTNPANLEKLQKMNEVFSDPKWTEANQHLNDYFTEKCK